ncbi:GNAT family N-acetyltransferase, partial [Micrococcus sp. HMSC31B01]|uniref:GNAT family N-acetyltransferase n=1 Tax=Micrococcus sp. HMSC31B01 TaxID=1581073 RepID=UPI000AF39AF5
MTDSPIAADRDGIRYLSGAIPAADDVRALYDAVGWSASTADMDTLMGGLQGSATVVTAFDGGRLVGLARVVSDGHTIAYLQDILVHPVHQRRGIASELLRHVFAGTAMSVSTCCSRTPRSASAPSTRPMASASPVTWRATSCAPSCASSPGTAEPGARVGTARRRPPR